MVRHGKFIATSIATPARIVHRQYTSAVNLTDRLCAPETECYQEDPYMLLSISASHFPFGEVGTLASHFG